MNIHILTISLSVGTVNGVLRLGSSTHIVVERTDIIEVIFFRSTLNRVTAVAAGEAAKNI